MKGQMALNSDENEEFMLVGRVKAAHGLKGEIFITLFAGEADWVDELNEIRLVAPSSQSLASQRFPQNTGQSSQNSPVKNAGQKLSGTESRVPVVQTFEISNLRFHKNGLILLSPDIRGRDAAEALRGWLLEIPRSLLVSAPGEQPYLTEIEGFQVFVKGRGEVGKIAGFSSNGMQDLLVISDGDAEYEVPFVEPFVEEIDYEAKCLRLDLPVGLLGEALAE